MGTLWATIQATTQLVENGRRGFQVPTA